MIQIEKHPKMISFLNLIVSIFSNAMKFIIAISIAIENLFIAMELFHYSSK